MHTRSALAVSTLILGFAVGSAVAGTVPYPNAGTENPTTYTFTAAATGDIVAYFAGSGASYDEVVGMDVNGVPSGVTGLDNQSSTAGESLDLGAVTAGDTIVFFDQVNTSGNTWYSDPSMNGDGGNHVYSTSVIANQVYSGSPAGTYVAFEDLAFNSGPGVTYDGPSDYNYFDNTFIFTNVASSVPEPVSWAILLVGFAGIGAAVRSTRSRSVSSAA